MTRLIAYLFAIFMIINLTGCSIWGESPSQESSLENESIDPILMENQTNQKIKGEDKKEEVEVIDDIANWTHPTKHIFENNGLVLKRVELTHNKTYPTFVLESLSGYYTGSSDFLYDVAEKNGYWDYTITDGKNYAHVYINKSNKMIYKIVSNEETLDARSLDLLEYDGVWYDVSFVNVKDHYSKLTLKFSKKNQAIMHLESSTDQTGKAQMDAELTFDFAQDARFMGHDSSGNRIHGKISLYNASIHYTPLSNIKYEDKKNVIAIGFGRFVKEDEYLNIQKSMNIIEEKYGFVDHHQGFYIPKTEDDSLYFVYEGKTTDGRYRIAVRYASTTVIHAWYLVDPETEVVEVEY